MLEYRVGESGFHRPVQRLFLVRGTYSEVYKGAIFIAELKKSDINSFGTIGLRF